MHDSGRGADNVLLFCQCFAHKELEMLPVKFKTLKSLLLMGCIMLNTTFSAEAGRARAGLWSDKKLTQIIVSANQFDNPGDRIVELSTHFINTPYVPNTLVGGPQVPEQLVVNLTELDCFTFLDVIEALRRASDAENFPAQLKNVRYRNGTVTYTARRHFFSDWVTDDAASVSDVTAGIGQGSVQAVIKQLNSKNDGSRWLPGITVTPREILYIPTDKINEELILTLQSGDYVGIYSEHAGLDVSHTGLIVINKDKVMLRHASSRSGVERVVDEELLVYLQGKSGLVVYRVKP